MAAILIIGVSLWYTNTLVNKIAQEERVKVKLWADAIKKKADLVKYTNELFNKIKIDERKKVELWAEATRQLSQDLSDYGFVLKVCKYTLNLIKIQSIKKEMIKTYNLKFSY